VRSLLFSEYFGPAQQIVAITKNKLREQLGSLLNPDKIEIKYLEAGLRFTAKLEKSDMETLGKAELAEFSEKFGDLVNQKVSRVIAEQINKFKFRTFGDLENNLRKLFDPRLYGAREIEISRDFVRKRLEDYIKSELPEGDTAENFRAKKLGIKCLLIKLGYQ
jgi:hypothetical protein